MCVNSVLDMFTMEVQTLSYVQAVCSRESRGSRSSSAKSTSSAYSHSCGMSSEVIGRSGGPTGTLSHTAQGSC